jgi:hypothetical protein
MHSQSGPSLDHNTNLHKLSIRLMGQLRRDADFLHKMGVMDYSLLLGIHFV